MLDLLQMKKRIMGFLATETKKGEDEPFDVGLNEREEKFVLPTK